MKTTHPHAMNTILRPKRLLSSVFVISLGFFALNSHIARAVTLLNFEATGDTFGGFGNWDGYSFTNNNDQPVVITSFNYQGMPFSGGLVGRSSATNSNFAGPTTLIDMFGIPVDGHITIPAGETWTVAFEKSAEGVLLSINRAEGPVSGILDSGVPIGGSVSSAFGFRGQDQFAAGSINGYVIPEPSAALLAGLALVGFMSRRHTGIH